MLSSGHEHSSICSLSFNVTTVLRKKKCTPTASCSQNLGHQQKEYRMLSRASPPSCSLCWPIVLWLLWVKRIQWVQSASKCNVFCLPPAICFAVATARSASQRDVPAASWTLKHWMAKHVPAQASRLSTCSGNCLRNALFFHKKKLQNPAGLWKLVKIWHLCNCNHLYGNRRLHTQHAGSGGMSSLRDAQSWCV